MEKTEITDLQNIWQTLDGKKGDIISRCEQYAMWTVPSVCPMENEDGAAQSKGNVAIGARLVNHLANRIVDTMFPSDRPFFALALTPEAMNKLTEELDEQENADFQVDLRKATAAAENLAMRELNLTAYRPVAVQAIQHQIITGNVVLHRNEDGSRVVYGIKDFCVQRDIQGSLRKCILKDAKTFGALSDQVQEQLHEKRPELTDDDEVTLYTYYWLQDSKWHRVQGVEDIILEDTRTSYKTVDLPVLALTWNISRGESYGRGLVEDHAVQFHNIDVSTLAMIDLIGIAADIKFLVDPASQIDIEEWNTAPRGAYLPGRKEDLSTPDYPKRLEIQVIRESINEWSRELAQAFLLNSAGIRDAERVTAEEIRFYARELEAAFGGLYSRLALGWQHKEAEYLISQIDFSTVADGGMTTFDVVVTTGLESLSREGQLDNLRLAVGDLQMLDAVPEDMRQVINKRKFAEFVFTNRGVKLAEFIYSDAELAQQQQEAMAQQQQLVAQEGQQQVAVEAGKEAVKGGKR